MSSLFSSEAHENHIYRAEDRYPGHPLVMVVKGLY